MSAVTLWFSIDGDGQPQLPGWYEVLYQWQYDGEPTNFRYWDGVNWTFDKAGKQHTYFGNEDTAGERWRGLAEDPAGMEMT